MALKEHVRLYSYQLELQFPLFLILCLSVSQSVCLSVLHPYLLILLLSFSIISFLSSYMYEDETQDDKQHPDDAIFIRRVTDQETKPK